MASTKAATWSAAGCLHRCDGEKDPTGEYCDPNDPNHRAAIEKPTTRLSVMLRDVRGLGLWRIDTQGWYAARELAGAVEVLALAAGTAAAGSGGPGTSRRPPKACGSA